MGPCPPSQLDVLILGAGPAGAATALALLRAGVERVGLVEQTPLRARRVGEAATPDVPGLLSRLGVTLRDEHLPYQGNLSAWGGPLRQEDFAPRGLALGLKLDRVRFERQLQQEAVAAGAILLSPASLEGFVRQERGWEVQLSYARGGEGPPSAQRHEVRLLVDASGRSASLARRLGVMRHRIDELVGLVSCLPGDLLSSLGQHLHTRILVEACPLGWWYATCLPGGALLLSLMSDGDLLKPFRAPERWREALRQAPQLCAFLDVARVEAAQVELEDFQRVPAFSGCLSRAAGPGWVAVGDALLSLDPLTSSGISGALRDGIEVVEQVLLPWLAGVSPAEPAQQWAQRANRSWLRFLRGRQQLYGQGAWGAEPFWRRRREPPEPGRRTRSVRGLP